MFIVRTPPGRFVELHTHPYAETFVLLAGTGRWTAGETILDVEAPVPRGLEGIRR